MALAVTVCVAVVVVGPRGGEEVEEPACGEGQGLLLDVPEAVLGADGDPVAAVVGLVGIVSVDGNPVASVDTVLAGEAAVVP